MRCGAVLVVWTEGETRNLECLMPRRELFVFCRGCLSLQGISASLCCRRAEHLPMFARPHASDDGKSVPSSRPVRPALAYDVQFAAVALSMLQEGVCVGLQSFQAALIRFGGVSKFWDSSDSTAFACCPYHVITVNSKFQLFVPRRHQSRPPLKIRRSVFLSSRR